MSRRKTQAGDLPPPVPINSIQMRKLAKSSKFVCKEDLWDMLVSWERVAGGDSQSGVRVPRTNRKQTVAVLRFKGREKAMVMKTTNLDEIESQWGLSTRTIAEDWGGREIGLYVDPSIMFGKKRVGGVRVCFRDGDRIVSFSGELSPEQAMRMRNGNKPPSQPGGGNFEPDPDWRKPPNQRSRHWGGPIAPVFHPGINWPGSQRWSGKPVADAPPDVARSFLDVLVTLEPRDKAAHDRYVAQVSAIIDSKQNADGGQYDGPPSDVPLPGDDSERRAGR